MGGTVFDCLRAAGQVVPAYEAERLWLHAASWSRTRLFTSLSDVADDGVAKAFFDAVRRRQSGEPLQYIVGEAWFYGRRFVVRPGCLIPRPETEVLAEEAARWLQNHAPTGRTLDIGTGSGVLAITLKAECVSTEVTAIDISTSALLIAEENARLIDVVVEFRRVDALALLTGDLGPYEGRFSLVVSNPPYIPTAEVLELDREVKDHEPRIALDGGDDGLTFYRRLALQGAGLFAAGPAALFLEVGHTQAHEVLPLFQDATWEGFDFDAVSDLRGVPRVIRGVRNG